MGKDDYRRVKGRNYTHACIDRPEARRYQTRARAFMDFMRMEEKAKSNGSSMPHDIYRCGTCFGWHISTKGGDND